MANALVPTVVDVPMDFTVIANSPSEMQAAQKSLILWAARKIQMVKNEIEAAREQFRLHKENKWNTEAWRGQILKHERRADFYKKIKAALEAGYYIVPPFPIDVFAIRVKRAKPHEYLGTHRDNHNQHAQILSQGEGRYVDPRPLRDSFTDTEKQGDGKTREVTRYFATEYQDADFPFKLARAEIRQATDKAMGLKVFDRLGVLPRKRAPDPIVCGQILVPNQRQWRYSEPQSVTFFVTWWLDTSTL
jgi:hypothetical protein